MKKRIQGLSLVALLVGASINAVLLIGLIQLFTDIVRTNRANRSLNTAYQDGLRAMENMETVLSQVGYRDIANGTSTKSETMDYWYMRPVISVESRTNNSSSDLIGSQNMTFPGITARFRGNSQGTIVDCTGAPATTVSGKWTELSYYVQNNQLLCDVRNPHDASLVTAVIANNVQALYAYLLEDAVGSLTRPSVNRFLNGISPKNNASSVFTAAPHDSGTTLGIRVALVMRTDEDVRTNATQSIQPLVGTPFTNFSTSVANTTRAYPTFIATIPFAYAAKGYKNNSDFDEGAPRILANYVNTGTLTNHAAFLTSIGGSQIAKVYSQGGTGNLIINLDSGNDPTVNCEITINGNSFKSCVKKGNTLQINDFSLKRDDVITINNFGTNAAVKGLRVYMVE